MTPVVLVLEKFSIKSKKWSYIFLLHYALGLVYKIHATLAANQMQKLKSLPT